MSGNKKQCFYLIYCKKDNSHVIVTDEALVRDADVDVEKNEEVTFKYHKQKYHGRVINISENREILRQKLECLQGEEKALRLATLAKTKSDAVITTKRVSKPPTRYSSDGDQTNNGSKPKRPKKNDPLEEGILKQSQNDGAEQRSKNKENSKPKKTFKAKSSEEEEASNESASCSDSEPELSSSKKRAMNRLGEKKNAANAAEEKSEKEKGGKVARSPNRSKKEKHQNLSSDEEDAGESELSSSKKRAMNRLGEKKNAANAAEEKSEKEKGGKVARSPNRSKREKHQNLSSDEEDAEESEGDDGRDVIGHPHRENQDDDEDEIIDNFPAFDDNQLFGPTFERQANKLLQNNIYCRPTIYRSAMGSSHASTHLARQLIDGVYKHEYLLRGTFSGQSPRAQGIDRQQEPMICLHRGARDAIAAYAMRYARKQNWREYPLAKVHDSMRQKLVEVKARHRRNNPRQNGNN